MRVVLGGIELKTFEKPDAIPLGGQQTLAINRFPGGDVSIQNMGPQYRPITWTGIFIGPDAYDRMIRIGNMRTAGKPITFETEKYSFPVVISEFLPDHRTNRRIPFSITLERVISQKGSGNAQKSDPIAKAVQAVAKSKQASTQKKQATGKEKYTIQKGDTLSGIAQRKKKKWEDIYNSNKKVLVNGPHKLKPGWVIYV
ncbi:LysM domain-containing protein [Brevibacillus laterosporus]|uniref:LysM domain/BON superfamily protein n=1 Tax=Brevibacillus laterosporus LMG 15441 TaxID=1042163 RepID=A0A075RDD3_BRELA|nr:LysM domain-containing protein [Brevibacillus laterosporus]AIG27415.1 LysM domain/BON superfamily protein [Brevibacillus laterosporus LMG 15441]RJL15347.1 LysM domain-containing protein [Brevibacillus laterosporus]TPH06489.1 LysM domain-containing protein [Brevibacillus laterosporus]